MNATIRTTLLAIFSVAGLLVSFLVLNVALISIQGISGDEPFWRMLLFFSVAFAFAFGLAAACGLPWFGPYTPWMAGRAFATAGAVGGVVHAFALKLLTDFEPELRALTDGGPLGLFALGATLSALAVAVVLGTALLRRTSSR